MPSNPEPPPARTTAPSQSLARLLESTDLTRAVPYLAAETLHRVIEECGLEACGSVVAAATRPQLTAILDFDLWRAPQPGHDPRFDHERFGEWIETLVEVDLEQAVQIVMRMPTPVVVAGVAGHLRVFDVATFEPTASTDDEPWESFSPNAEHQEREIGGYRVRARRRENSDALIALLVELWSTDATAFRTIMRGCCQLSHEGRESDGLDMLAEVPEQFLDDEARAREDRRQVRGYLAPADARAFLSVARHGDAAGLRAIADEYRRSADRVVAGTVDARGDTSGLEEQIDRRIDKQFVEQSDQRTAAGDADPVSVVETVRGVVDILTAAGLMPEAPRTLLGSGNVDEPRTTLMLLMTHARATNEDAFLARGEELAFLANTLMAGCALQRRTFTLQEASDAAAAICNLGLEAWPAPPGHAHLVEHDLISAFGVGWAVLHRDVSLFVAEQLIATIGGLPRRGAVTDAGLRALKRALATHRLAGTPWLAADWLDILSTLDTPAWHGLLGLFSECPVVPAVVTAIVERTTGRIDPKAFAFISTQAQVDTIRRFMARLPDLLSS